MTTPNIGRMFYCDEEMKIQLENENLGNIYNFLNNDFIINNIKYENYFAVPYTISFSLKVSYPGLLIGTGYNRIPGLIKNDNDENKDDYKTGFFFDHTTGMPYIPGSTVKGILKSIFPFEQKYFNDSDYYAQEKIYYIEKLYNQIKSPKPEFTTLYKSKLEKLDFNSCKKLEEIFFNKHIFFDAYLTDLNKNSVIFAKDTIATHTNGRMGKVNPLHFLKIKSGSKINFQFKFDKNRLIENKLNEEVLAEFYKIILKETGIGAKRNVGYGILE